MPNAIHHFPNGATTVKPRDRASAEAKGVCARYAVPTLPDAWQIGPSSHHRLITEGEECPNRAAYIDEILRRRKA